LRAEFKGETGEAGGWAKESSRLDGGFDSHYLTAGRKI
jgi:hypothetical protein